jgi:hypothetical protein
MATLLRVPTEAIIENSDDRVTYVMAQKMALRVTYLLAPLATYLLTVMN